MSSDSTSDFFIISTKFHFTLDFITTSEFSWVFFLKGFEKSLIKNLFVAVFLAGLFWLRLRSLEVEAGVGDDPDDQERGEAEEELKISLIRTIYISWP